MISCKMTLERSTKNKHLYRLADGESGPESIYIEKDKLPNPPPQEVTLSVDINKPL